MHDTSTQERASHSPISPPLPKQRGERLRWTRLYGACQALATARAAQAYDGISLVVTPDPSSADQFSAELEFFLAGDANTPLMRFPDWETLPYDAFSPHQDIISDRLRVLVALDSMRRGVLVVPVGTLMGRPPPPEFLARYSLSLKVGDRLDLDNMRQKLTRAGYRAVSQVTEHGEFAVRGSLLDLFPMGADTPMRVDLFDDEVESIRMFDPESQRSSEKVDGVDLLPAREVPIDAEGIAKFRGAWRSRFEGDPTNSLVYTGVSDGNAPPGIEYYLPLFFDDTSSLFDYMPDDVLSIALDGVEDAAERLWSDTSDRYESRRYDIERPVLTPAELYFQANEVFRLLNEGRRITIGTDSGSTAVRFSTRVGDPLPIDARAAEPMARVNGFLQDTKAHVLFVADSPGRQETLTESFGRNGIRLQRVSNWAEFLSSDAAHCITVGTVERGATIGNPNIAIIAETQLFGERVKQRRRRKRNTRDAESVVRDLTELTEGYPVVHEDHGVGRYLGLQTITTGGSTAEFLTIEYSGGDKLYVPVMSLHLISRYTGAAPETAPMHKLGGTQWTKAKRKAAEKVHDVAAELLEIHARRAARQGRQFNIDTAQYEAFCQGFPFEETVDQEAAINAVINDMTGPTPMDRLTCGDVGFGKTEVALRAAFVSVNDGLQVAVLVPTTLLAQQHFQTFTDRFADWPVRVELMSRFRSKKEQDVVVNGLADGTVDIIIGTHKLLQPDIAFKRLGLVVVDEEHRFGVRHKERLKSLRAEVDMLTLTATPIPRTLNMAFAGMRDLSLIATPPERRLAVKTFVREWDNATLREACIREIRRGGQIYFVHNKVDNIGKVARELQELVPEATIEVAHGQMRERELERVMTDFYHRRFNTLVCTTIVETGIDVPTANTIIINRADHFGLAQLHQLRGRVGRSHHRAYAYLITPPRKAMTADAVKRLEAIESLEELGIGFTLATHDLEIRGAGEVLGDEQSGQMNEIGYTLYTQLLERAVNALKAGQTPELDRPLDHGVEMDLHMPALIPEDYLPDVHTRLIMYKRIASAKELGELDELQVEMIDRFGLFPPQVRTLFSVTELKLKATPLGIKKIDFGSTSGRVIFGEDADVNPMTLVKLVQTRSKHFKFDGPQVLRVQMQMEDHEARIKIVSELIDQLGVQEAA